MNPALLFTLAAVIAAVGILVSFKKLMANIQTMVEEQKLNQELLQKEQTRYFIRTALIEAIPIVLIIFGFMQIENTHLETTSRIAPVLIIGGVVIYAVTNILLIRNDLLATTDHSKEIKGYLNSLIFIGIATISAIPIISLIGLFL